MMSPQIEELVRKRAVVKRKITLNFTKLEAAGDMYFSESIRNLMDEICSLDDDISNLYLGEDQSEISKQCDKELNSQVDYASEINLKLSKFVSPVVKNVLSPSEATNCDLKLPVLHCGNFSGEGAHNLEFSTFIGQFNNVIGLRSNLSNATKFTYLKTYLKGYALKVVNHLQVTDFNYTVALSLLEKEFLNKEAITDDLFAKFLNLKPKNNDLMEVKIYINEVRCVFSDLSNYGVDLLAADSSLKLVSHIVLGRIPTTLRQELVRKVDNNYPNLNELFEHYVDLVRTLSVKSGGYQPRGPPTFERKVENNFSTQHRVDDSPKNEGAKVCKFCQIPGHTLTACRKYGNYESRIRRCDELKICAYCSSSKHLKNSCPRKMNYDCMVCGYCGTGPTLVPLV